MKEPINGLSLPDDDYDYDYDSIRAETCPRKYNVK
jgi:hypothetical protein